MDKLEKFYKEVINLIEHCGVQKFIKEEEVDYIIRCVSEIKANIEKE